MFRQQIVSLCAIASHWGWQVHVYSFLFLHLASIFSLDIEIDERENTITISHLFNMNFVIFLTTCLVWIYLLLIIGSVSLGQPTPINNERQPSIANANVNQITSTILRYDYLFILLIFGGDEPANNV